MLKFERKFLLGIDRLLIWQIIGLDTCHFSDYLYHHFLSLRPIKIYMQAHRYGKTSETALILK